MSVHLSAIPLHHDLQGLSLSVDPDYFIHRLIHIFPPSIRKEILVHQPWKIVRGLVVPVLNDGSGFIFIDHERIDLEDPSFVYLFYQSIGELLAERISLLDKFQRREFVTAFAGTAARRFEGSPDYVPVAMDPKPLYVFQELLWSDDASELNLSKLWDQSKNVAEARDPYKVMREIGPFLRMPHAQEFASLTRKTIKFLKGRDVAVDWSLQSEQDPVSQSGQTTFRLQSLWERMAWETQLLQGISLAIEPTLATEGRFKSPFLASDALFLSGANFRVQYEGLKFHARVQMGYAVRRFVETRDKVPGYEVMLGVHEQEGEGDSWHLAASARHGLDLETDGAKRDPFLAGVYFEIGI